MIEDERSDGSDNAEGASPEEPRETPPEQPRETPPEASADAPAEEPTGAPPGAAADDPAAEAPGAADDAPISQTPEATADDPPADTSDDPPADTSDDPPGETPAAPADGDLSADAPSPEGTEGAPSERPARERPTRSDAAGPAEVVPGADLEPDLVLDEPQQDDRYGEAAERYPESADATESEDGAAAVSADGEPPQETSARPAPMKLAADARYRATGKRKTSVARVILKPGGGEYTINGRSLEEFFPRPTLQRTARQPLATTGNDSRMDVVAKLHGGGVSAQAGALRHGVARALVEADPNLRGELKRRGFLTRDPRVKERKKAGLKKARKRPQFSKR